MPDGTIGRQYDAALIGGGPAGSTAARLLALWGYSVVLLAPPRRGHDRAETLPPSCRRLFRLLDIHEDIDRAGFYPTSGNTSWWGSDEARVETYPYADGCGYQVLRSEFDALLLHLARRAGAEVLQESVEAVKLGDGAVVRLRSGGEIRARFALDASGRAGVIARQGFRTADSAFRGLAICCYWNSRASGEASDTTLIESYEDGWAWSVPVSKTRRFVTAMIDARTTRTRRGHGLLAAYRHEIDKTRAIRNVLAHAEPDGAPAACDSSLFHALQYAGTQFLLVGDAASFVDPLSSYGVKKAMSSAWLAATVVNTCLRRPESSSMALDHFNRREAQAYAAQMRQTAAHFRVVASRQPHPFWTSRAQAPSETLFYTEPELANALEELKRAPSINLRRAPTVHTRPVPSVQGCEIVLSDRLSAPGLPPEVEYMQGVHLWSLVNIAERHSQIPDLFAAYNQAYPPVAMPNFLSALSVLVAKRVLQNEVRKV